MRSCSTRHLNDYPDPEHADRTRRPGFVLLLMGRIWWPAAVWALLVISIVHSSAPFGGPVGTITGMFSDLFYSDPAVVGGGHDAADADGGVRAVLRGATGGRQGTRADPAARRSRSGPGFWIGATAAVLLVVVIFWMTWHCTSAASAPDGREVRPGDGQRQRCCRRWRTWPRCPTPATPR